MSVNVPTSEEFEELKSRVEALENAQPVDPPNPQPEGIIFQTNWSDDAGFHVTNAELSSGAGPTGWNASHTNGTGYWQCVNSGGEDGSNVMRLHYDPRLKTAANSLIKHLTDDPATGFDELYIRYKMRFPSKMKFGSDEPSVAQSNMDYWKQYRIFQNAHPTDKSTWADAMEPTSDKAQVVVNFINGNAELYGTRMTATIHARERYTQITQEPSPNWPPTYAVEPNRQNKRPFTIDQGNRGYFEQLFPIDWTTPLNEGRLVEPPKWATIETHIKLASSLGADDGVFEFWFGGVPQETLTGYHKYHLPPEVSGFPTPRVKAGMNLLIFMDNEGRWFRQAKEDDPAIEPWIEFDSVVVSTKPIGVDYKVGG